MPVQARSLFCIRGFAVAVIAVVRVGFLRISDSFGRAETGVNPVAAGVGSVMSRSLSFSKLLSVPVFATS